MIYLDFEECQNCVALIDLSLVVENYLPVCLSNRVLTRACGAWMSRTQELRIRVYATTVVRT